MKLALPALVLLVSVLQLSAEDVTTAKAVCNLYRKGPSKTSFRLEGVVTRNSRTSEGVSLFLEDGTGATAILFQGKNQLEVGDKIIARGEVIVDDRLTSWTYSRDIKVIGKGTPPPPVSTTIADILDGRHDNRLVTVCGTVSDIVEDDVERGNYHVFIRKGQDILSLTAYGKPDDLPPLHAEISITGFPMPCSGDWRPFQGYGIVSDPRNIKIIRPAPTDLFVVPPLDPFLHGKASQLFELDRRFVDGTVIATWGKNHALLNTKAYRIVEATFAKDAPLPHVGEFIRVVGLPDTDLFNINLANAIWRKETGTPSVEGRPTETTMSQLITNEGKRHKFLATCHGKVLRLRGLVRGITQIDPVEAKIYIEDDSRIMPVDISSCPKTADGLEVGSGIEITAVCHMETEPWKPNAPLPKIKGFTLICRTVDDITVISRPPWWTPLRLLIVIGSLFAGLVAIGIWNRVLNRLVERRSRQLQQEQKARLGEKLKVGERTRLAVELHDSLSQTLTGVAFQIDAAEKARQRDPSQIKKYLDVARQTLASCRSELKNCLWDLRNNALEDTHAEAAIRHTVEPHVGDAELSVSFAVPRKTMTDNTFHAVLRILRELAANAARHGHASHIDIVGHQADGLLTVSVRDDGCGFDPDHHVGSDEGHFGLLGIAERIETLAGTLEIHSRPGQGAQINFSLPL